MGILLYKNWSFKIHFQFILYVTHGNNNDNFNFDRSEVFEPVVKYTVSIFTISNEEK